MSAMAAFCTSCTKLAHRQISNGLAGAVLCLIGALPGFAQATGVETEGGNAAPSTVEATNVLPHQKSEIELASYTDQQIGALLQQWPRLDATQRRDLLAEVRKRMRAAGESANTPLVSQRAPSLTVRIQRANSQHRYGKPAPRNAPSERRGNGLEAGAKDQRIDGKRAEETLAAEKRTERGQTEKRSQSQRLPRDLVIRATVTRTLPDGSVVTTKETLMPRVVAERPATASGVRSVESGVDASGQVNAEQRSRGTVTVVRTQVRFGAGFDRRQHGDVATDQNGVSVRRVSTLNNGETADLTQER